MLCRVVARTNADLQRVLDALVSAEGVVRSTTVISLATQVPYRVLPLVRAAAGASGQGAFDARPLSGAGPEASFNHVTCDYSVFDGEGYLGMHKCCAMAVV